MSVTLPSTLTSIGPYAFFDCKGLTSITLPDSVSTIAFRTFERCSFLEKINFPSTLTRIDEYAFDSCSKIASLTFPDSLTRIGERAFWKCERLISVSLHHTLTDFDRCAFQDCTALTSVTFRPLVSAVFLAWALGRMRNRSNWQLTPIIRMRNVIRLLVALATTRRGAYTIDSKGKLRVFQGCTSLEIEDKPEVRPRRTAPRRYYNDRARRYPPWLNNNRANSLPWVEYQLH